MVLLHEGQWHGPVPHNAIRQGRDACAVYDVPSKVKHLKRQIGGHGTPQVSLRHHATKKNVMVPKYEMHHTHNRQLISTTVALTNRSAVTELIVAQVKRLEVAIAFKCVGEVNPVLVHEQVPCRQD